jgi:hypothetical protein
MEELKGNERKQKINREKRTKELQSNGHIYKQNN